MQSHLPSYEIVVVENSPNLNSILERTPNKHCSGISRKVSAKACLETMRDAVYLVDLMLEDMDGLSLIEEIRMRKPDIPVIAFIATTSTPDFELEEQALRKMAFQSGANALFIAPLNLGEIVGTLDRLALEYQAEAVA